MNEGAFRGIVLVAVAVIVGLILLGSGLDDTVSTAREDAGSGATDDSGDSSGDTGVTDEGDDSVASPVDPSSINVIVANGSGVDAAAATVSATLTELGYAPLEPTNTTVESTETPLDAVYYATSPNSEAQARKVAEDLALPDTAILPYPPDPATAPAPIGFAQVLVVLGSSPGQLVTPAA